MNKTIWITCLIMWTLPALAQDAPSTGVAADAPWYMHLIGGILALATPVIMGWMHKYQAKKRQAIDAEIKLAEKQGKSVDLARRGERIAVIVAGEALDALDDHIDDLLAQAKAGTLTLESMRPVMDDVWDSIRDTDDPQVKIAIADLKESAKLLTEEALAKWIKNDALRAILGHLSGFLGDRAETLLIGGTDPN